MRTQLTLTSLVAATLFSTPSRAEDLFVGPVLDGAPFSEIHDAVDAALPGDTIHVAAGLYDTFTVNKPLRIVGEGSGVVTVQDREAETGVVIEDLGAGATVVLSGLTVLEALDSSPGDAAPQLLIQDCDGIVVLHDIHALPVAGGNYIQRVVYAIEVAQLLVTHCNFVGEAESGNNFAGGVPLWLSYTTAWIADTTLLAGDSTPGLPVFPVPLAGAPGLHVRDLSEATVSRCVIRGGDGAANIGVGVWNDEGGAGISLWSSTLHLAGGPGNLVFGGDAGSGPDQLPSPGGAAIRAEFTSKVVHASDVTLVPGYGSLGESAPGVLHVVDFLFGSPLGTTTALATRSATLSVSPAQVALGGSLALELAGNPGGTQVPFAALAPGAPIALEGVEGAWWLDLFVNFNLGAFALDGSGLGSTVLVVPADPTLSGRAIYLQSFEFAGAFLGFSNPAVFTITP